jgi:hypothetical protein
MLCHWIEMLQRWPVIFGGGDVVQKSSNVPFGGSDASAFRNSRDHLTIVSEQHCWRTLGGFETTDFAEASQAMREGCDLQQVVYRLRHGEEMLVDLSNPGGRLARCSAQAIEEINTLVPGIVDRMHVSNSVRRIVGEDLGAELAYSARYDWELTALRQSVFSYLEENHAELLEPVQPPLFAKGIQKKRDLYAAPQNVMDDYNAFRAFYSEFVQPGFWPSHKALNQSLIYENHSVWKSLEKLGDNKMFILSAGLALAYGYQAATLDDQIFFCEFHRQNDSSAMTRTRDFKGIFGAHPPKSGSWLVVDKAYTGGSIRAAAKLIREEYGYDTVVKSVALFPKSLSALASSEYAVFAGRLFHVPSIIGRLRIEDWPLELLRLGDEENFCI